MKKEKFRDKIRNRWYKRFPKEDRIAAKTYWTIIVEEAIMKDISLEAAIMEDIEATSTGTPYDSTEQARMSHVYHRLLAGGTERAEKFVDLIVNRLWDKNVFQEDRLPDQLFIR